MNLTRNEFEYLSDPLAIYLYFLTKITLSSSKVAVEVGKEADQDSQEVLDLKQEATYNEEYESARLKRRVSTNLLAGKKAKKERKAKKEEKAEQEKNSTKGRSSVKEDESTRFKRRITVCTCQRRVKEGVLAKKKVKKEITAKKETKAKTEKKAKKEENAKAKQEKSEQ